MDDHYKKLEQMYLNAPVQKIYAGINIIIGNGTAVVTLPVHEKFFHAGGSLHGSVYFRLLDDAAYFSVNSMIRDVFMLTSSFQIDLLRPVSRGTLKAVGKVLSGNKNIFLAKSDLYDQRNILVATGKGTFMKSRLLLNSIQGYEKI